jgi:hypothetical protein
MPYECQHERVFKITGKTSDLCNWQFPDGATGSGYVPNIKGIGGGDYLRLKICVSCHRLLDLDTQAINDLNDKASGLGEW